MRYISAFVLFFASTASFAAESILEENTLLMLEKIPDLYLGLMFFLIFIIFTCFLRIFVVLSFVQKALELNNFLFPYVVFVLSLVLSLFLVRDSVDLYKKQVWAPYASKQISKKKMLTESVAVLDGYVNSVLAKSSKKAEKESSVLANKGLESKLALFLLVELKAALLISLMIYLPFVLVDFLIASVFLMLGLTNMPTANISLVLKLLIFVMADGWNILTNSLLRSFS